MTVSSVDPNFNAYIGNGVNDTFAYTFRLDDVAWLNVTVNNVATTNFTLDTVLDQIVFLPGFIPPVDSIVVLYTTIPSTQLVNYTAYDAFPAETHEAALDKLTLIIQQILTGPNNDVGRSIKFPSGDEANPILPSSNNRIRKYVTFDEDGNVIVSEGTIIDDVSVKWKGDWILNQYNKFDMVLDSGWTMIANKTTTERAAPQPVGSDYNIYDGTLTSTNVLAKQIIIGQRYTPDNKSQLISGYRIYTHAGQQYNVRSIKDPLGTPIINQVGTFTAANTGWISFNIDPVFLNVGETADLVIIITEPDLTPTIFTGNWDYRTPTNGTTPAAGTISHANKFPSSFRINKTDDSLADRSAELEALSSGDKISYFDQEWIIQTVADNGTWMDFGISPAVQGNTAGVFEFTFETVTQTPIDYGIDSGYWSADTAISGLFGADVTYPSIIPDDNQYIVDILVQDYTTPVDWDLVAISADAALQPTNDVVGTVPVGGIIMYNGLLSVLPMNFQLCDGTNGTPNMTNSFVYGTITEGEIGDTGGSPDAVLVSHGHTASFSGNALPTHGHTLRGTQASAGSLLLPVNNANANNNVPSNDPVTPVSAGTPSGSVSVVANGVSGVDANIPPYVKLAYIQRMS